MPTERDPRLLGTWQTDPGDSESLRRFGRVTQIFRPDGTMAYVVHEGGNDRAMLLVYRTEGSTLITDQPTFPREDRARYQIEGDLLLVTSVEGGTSRYVRVSHDCPMPPLEAEARGKLAAMSAAISSEFPSKTWGAGSSLLEYHAAGHFRLWYPSGWTCEPQYDKQPAVVLSDPQSGLGRLRIGVIDFEPPRRGLLKRQVSPDQIVKEVFEMLRRRYPDAREVQLGNKVAMQHGLSSEDETARAWAFARGKSVIMATYSVPKEATASFLSGPEIGIVMKILTTLILEA